MITITMQVDAPVGMEQAVKEDLAMYCERYGDCRVICIYEKKDAEQLLMEAGFGGSAVNPRGAAESIEKRS